MRTHTRLLLAALASTLVLGLAVGAASANRLSFTNNNLFRVTWSGLRFIDQGGTERITCPVTLEGSFHSSTIRKVRGALIGFVSTASVRGAQAAGGCTGGAATILTASLPWHITYDSFTGTLPRPTGIIILGHRTAFRVEVLGFLCLYQENGTARVRGRVEIEPNGLITGDTPLTDQLPRFEGNSTLFCPTSAGFGSTGTVRALPGGGNVRVTLI